MIITKTNISCIVYDTDGRYVRYDGSSNTKTEAHIDGLYYASKF